IEDNNKIQKEKHIPFLGKKRAFAAGICFIVFLFISWFVVTKDILTFDTVIRECIYGVRSDGLTVFFRTITCLGNWNTITLICCLFLLLPRLRSSFGLPLSAAAILASLIQKALKVSFHRARPDLTLHLIHQGGYAFPSGHSFSVLVFYGMLLFLCRRNLKNKTAANLVMLLLSGLIPLTGFSRIYLGVHYPTDVLGGWFMGLCVLIVFLSAYDFFQRKGSKL
ncbi:MAG: phosphatase PAP2 family protein, partial [Eubacteriales bacterium]|nr:phosphatase PAP2 family protein [Eubacteriales bacterium]